MALNVTSLVNATSLSITTKTKILNNFCAKHNYQDTINGAPNPQTKVQFFNQVVSEFIRDAVVSQAAETDAITARNTTTETTSAEIIL